MVTAIALSFVAITLISSYYRFQHIVQMAEDTQPEEMGATAEDVLRVQLARYLAGCARRGTSFSVTLIQPGDPDIQVRMDEPFIDAIRHAVRHDDITCVYNDQTAVLLTEIEPEDTGSVIARVLEMVADQCAGVAHGQLRAGISSYPGHGLSGRELLDVALDGLAGTSEETPVNMPEIVDVDEEAEEEAGRVEAVGESVADDAFEWEEDEEEAKDRTSWKERRQNAMLDTLTGVLKPSAISAYMQRMMSELRRKKQKAALFCIGVNNMDHINRFHGEEAGDVVLVGVSKILQEHLRADDLIGRHEKNAFLVLAQCSIEQAEIIGKRVSTLVQQSEFVAENKKLKTSITLGVATYPEHGRNLHHLYTAGQKVLDHSRENDIRAYAVYDSEIHDKVPSKPMKSIKSVQA